MDRQCCIVRDGAGMGVRRVTDPGVGTLVCTGLFSHCGELYEQTELTIDQLSALCSAGIDISMEFDDPLALRVDGQCSLLLDALIAWLGPIADKCKDGIRP